MTDVAPPADPAQAHPRRGSSVVIGEPGRLRSDMLAALTEWAAVPGVETLTVGAARHRAFLLDPTPEAVAEVVQRWIPGPNRDLAVRSYRPDVDRTLGSFLYLHGGGWVLGSLESDDALCRRLANATGCIVHSLDYRLAPETKFPGAVEDVYAAMCWVCDEDATDVQGPVIGGTSAGGNLAAAACLLARERGGPRPSMQVLIVPNLWIRARTESRRAFAAGYRPSAASLEWYERNYLRNEQDAMDPLASPCTADDLSGLPPALVVTAEFDCLRDEAEMYAERLRAAGVNSTLIRYAGTVHGFMFLPVEVARLLTGHVGEIVRSRLASE